MPSLQQIEKIAKSLESLTSYANLQAQASARYILYGVHEDEKNFPLFDVKLTFRTENMAYLCFEVACTFYKEGRSDSATAFFDRGAQLLEYNYANSQSEIPEHGYNLMICGLAYYCACQYSKAYIMIKKGGYEGSIEKMISAFLSRRFLALENEIKDVLLHEGKNEVTPFDILIARAFSLLLNYFYFGEKKYLIESIEILADATELALLDGSAEIWWLLRFLHIVIEGINVSSLWSNLRNHPLFAVDVNGWDKVWDSLGMPERDWNASAKEKIEQYVYSQTFKKTPVTELFVSQRKALQKVLMEEGSVVSMPTSSGKTRIAEIVILQSLLRDEFSKVLYIAPFRSLAYEVEETLSSTFNPIGFSVTHLYGGSQFTTLDRREMENARVVIATPEKAKAILRINDEILRSVKLVVMDEGHLIGARQREIANEMFTEELRRVVKMNQGKFLLLSAVLPNADEISQWITSKNDNVVSDTWRPSSQRIGLMCYHKNRIDIEWRGEVKCFNRGFIKSNGDKKELIAKAALRLSELGSVMIYVPRKNWVLPNARTMLNLIKDEPDIDWGEDDSDWIKFGLVCQETEEDKEYFELAKKGILCHSAQLKADIRRYMERLLRKGKARFIFATNTLAQGVNLGVSTVIVMNVVLGHNTYLSTNDFWNMAGRAGRSYIDTEGKLLFVCDCSNDENIHRRQAGIYLDKLSTDRAVSGVYTYLKKLCSVCEKNGVQFELLLELISENRLDSIPQEGEDMVWGDFFELIDDSLLSLDLAYRDNENDDMSWVEEHFINSLAVIQEENEILRKHYIDILKARVYSIRGLLRSDIIPHAFASSGIPLKAAMFLEDKISDIRDIADEYLGSQKEMDDKLYLFYQFDKIVQDIPSARIKVHTMDVLDCIRQKWIAGKPMDSKELPMAEEYYSNTISWLMNALVNRFYDNEGDRYKKLFEEMSLIAANGLPNRWAAQIYLCGINSRMVATELSMLIKEPESVVTISSVASYLRNTASELEANSNCSDLAKAWLKLVIKKPVSNIKEIAPIKRFRFEKGAEDDLPDFLICKRQDENTYLCSVDFKYKLIVNDKDGYQFSNVADIPGVYFRRDNDVWKMENVNPYISVLEA